MDRFLPTALPLARTEQEKMTLLEACAKFPTQAKVLQERLHERRNGEMKDSSWLQHWWNTAGYLQVRDPVVINVSYFFHFSDDPTLPVDKPRNVTRGAAILTSLAQFRQQVVTGTLPADKVGRPPKETFLCSTAYKYMFNATRIPHREMDSYKMYDPARHGHCIVARQGQFFAVDFIDKSTGLPYPIDVLEDRLMKCIRIADDESGAEPLELGWLTSQDRDSWADARDEMIRVGGSKMEEALELLESGAFMLNLDDEEVVSRKQCAELFLHGNISSGHNRWFDKSIQILCGNNGKAGLCGEHSSKWNFIYGCSLFCCRHR
jgi:carnitine O-acetyltransferase